MHVSQTLTLMKPYCGKDQCDPASTQVVRVVQGARREAAKTGKVPQDAADVYELCKKKLDEGNWPEHAKQQKSCIAMPNKKNMTILRSLKKNVHTRYFFKLSTSDEEERLRWIARLGAGDICPLVDRLKRRVVQTIPDVLKDKFWKGRKVNDKWMLERRRFFCACDGCLPEKRNGCTECTVPSLSKIAETSVVPVGRTEQEVNLKVTTHEFDEGRLKKNERVLVVAQVQDDNQLRCLTNGSKWKKLGDRYIVVFLLVDAADAEVKWGLGVVQSVAGGELTVKVLLNNKRLIAGDTIKVVDNGDVKLCSSQQPKFQVLSVEMPAVTRRACDEMFEEDAING